MRQTQHNKAFTIVELLTVMAVIALLIGLLVPALALVKDRAKDIQQRAQFHAISAGLEMFRADFGDYPDSKDNASPTVHPYDPTTYTGANKLAEAMVGLDYLGFHPNSDFRSDGVNEVANKLGVRADYVVYYAFDDAQDVWQSAQENIQARRGPYVELENANAFRMDEVYAPAANLSSLFGTGWDGQYPMVLCDVYARKRSGAGGKKTGTPILYFRAQTFNTIQNSEVSRANSIYDYRNNWRMLNLGMPDTGAPHFITGADTADNYVNFDDMILNKNVTAIRRPYRAGSFILWSAGKDGMFGTADDVFNFTREAE